MFYFLELFVLLKKRAKVVTKQIITSTILFSVPLAWLKSIFTFELLSFSPSLSLSLCWWWFINETIIHNETPPDHPPSPLPIYTHSNTDESFWSPQIRISAMQRNDSTRRLRLFSETVGFRSRMLCKYLRCSRDNRFFGLLQPPPNQLRLRNMLLD